MLKKIILHGELVNHVPGGEFECDFYHATEAVSALEANFPGFHDRIRDKMLYVVPGEDPEGEPLNEDQALRYKLGSDTLHIIPAVEGEGGGGSGGGRRNIGKALLGVVLIAVSFGVGGFVAGGLGSTATIGSLSLGVTGTQLLMMGVGLVLQGLIQPPKPPEAPEREVSSFYNGPLNTQTEGSIVPYTAGQDVIVGGVVIHTDLVIEQVI